MDADPEISRRQFLRLGLYGAGTACLGKGFLNTLPFQIQLKSQPIRLAGLPQAFHGLKIAQLSDIHSSLIVSRDHIARAASLAMSFRPDLIVLTGDFISGETRLAHGSMGKFEARYLDRCVEALKPLAAPLGIYAVLGNHDFWSGEAAVSAIMEEFERGLGVAWLRNRHVLLERGGDQLALLGVDDYWEDSCSLSNAYSGLDGRTVKILLSHNPDINEAILPTMRIDLVLSGHTHGGQVALPFIGMPFLPSRFGQKYRQGLVRDGARQTYVTRGVGHLVAPVRYNCPPEVTFITLV